VLILQRGYLGSFFCKTPPPGSARRQFRPARKKQKSGTCFFSAISKNTSPAPPSLLRLISLVSSPSASHAASARLPCTCMGLRRRCSCSSPPPAPASPPPGAVRWRRALARLESGAGTEPARRSGFAANEGSAAREAAFRIEPHAPASPAQRRAGVRAERAVEARRAARRARRARARPWASPALLVAFAARARVELSSRMCGGRRAPPRLSKMALARKRCAGYPTKAAPPALAYRRPGTPAGTAHAGAASRMPRRESPRSVSPPCGYAPNAQPGPSARAHGDGRDPGERKTIRLLDVLWGDSEDAERGPAGARTFRVFRKNVAKRRILRAARGDTHSSRIASIVCVARAADASKSTI
jgi:hypothetical protein